MPSRNLVYSRRETSLPKQFDQWRTNTKIVYIIAGGDPKKLGEHDGSIVSMAWSPDANSLACGDESGVVRVWSIDSKVERLVLKGHAGAVRNALFSPNGKILVTGDGYSKQSQRVFAITADKQIYMLDYIYLGGLSPVMGTPVGNKLVLWDAATGKLATRSQNGIATAPDLVLSRWHTTVDHGS